jgi:hypothetical protein
MAEKRSAKIIAKPACVPALRISSTGRRETIPKATAPARGQYADEIP